MWHRMRAIILSTAGKSYYSAVTPHCPTGPAARTKSPQRSGVGVGACVPREACLCSVSGIQIPC